MTQAQPSIASQQSHRAPKELVMHEDNKAAEMIANLTTYLNKWRQGQASEEELNRLIELVSPQLKNMASRILRRSGRDIRIVETGDLFNTFFDRVTGRWNDWKSRSQFYGVAAMLMRFIVIELVRRELGTKKKGASNRRSREFLPFDENDFVIQSLTQISGLPSAGLRAKSEMILSIHQGLEALEKMDPRKARVIEQYYFGGLTVDEITQTLQLSRATVNSELKLGKAFLRRFLEGSQRAELHHERGAK